MVGRRGFFHFQGNAYPEVVTVVGQTPLMMAVSQGHAAAIELLVLKGMHVTFNPCIKEFFY